MADNNTNNRENNSPRKSNFIDRSVDDAFEGVSLILKIFLKLVISFNIWFILITFFLLIPLMSLIIFGPWNFGKGLLGINNGRNAIEDITEGSYSAGSYLRQVKDDHELNFNVGVKYIGDNKKRNNRRSESITFDDINDTSNNRVIEVNDN